MNNKNETLYYRPERFEDLAQICRQVNNPHFLSGGDMQIQGGIEGKTLIDLQALPLNGTSLGSEGQRISGISTLSTLSELCLTWPDLQYAIRVEGGQNLRNSLSLDNYLRQAGPRSPLLCCLRAMNVQLEMMPGADLISLEDYLQSERHDHAHYVAQLRYDGVKQLRYAQVGRSPLDFPTICVSVARFNTHLRVAVGGLNIFLPTFELPTDATEGISRLQQLLKDSGDVWASADYRQSVGAVLFQRCIREGDEPCK